MKIQCSHCERLLEYPAMFSHSYSKKYKVMRYYNVCLLCKQIVSREWALNHAEYMKEYRRKYYQTHKAKFREYKRKSRLRIVELENAEKAMLQLKRA